MKKLSLAALLFGSAISALAQQHYPIFTQNYVNPFLINPSLITLERRLEINGIFRQQWTGIVDAPKTMQLDVQYPVNPKMSVALNLYNDKTIMLSSSGALATFGYKVRLSSYHILGFGLSAGFISNQIDLNDVPDIDLVDPVLLNSANNFDFDGQFGIHYQNRRFIAGFSLLKLVDNRPFKEGTVLKETFDPFKDRAAIISYRLNLSNVISLQPTVYYRSTFNGYEYFEGVIQLGYRDIVTIGGGYRTDFGPHVMMRLRIKDFHIGYAYDFPATRYGGSTGGTNEIQLKWLSKRTVEPIENLARKDSINEDQEEVVVTEPEEKKTAENPVVDDFTDKAETIAEQPVVSIPIEKTEPVVSPESVEAVVQEENTNGPIYDLVVGVFVRKLHADRYARELAKEGIETTVKHKSETNYYYVTVPKFATKTITLDRVLEIRKSTKFTDAWFERFE